MVPYVWKEIPQTEIPAYIGKALRIVNGDDIIQGLLIDEYPEGFYLELGENQTYMVDHETYITEDTKFYAVEVISLT